MSNMRIPSRRAPTVEDARRLQDNKNQGTRTKIPPPRPPPPNFTLAKSKSAWSLSPTENTLSLIEWSPPGSPKQVFNTHSRFNGSISSSFSSSTSSLASSKRSYEFDNYSDWLQVTNSTFYPKLPSNSSSNTLTSNISANIGIPKLGPGPTIIRAAPPKKKNLRPTVSASTSREVSPLPPYFQNGLLTPTRVDDIEKGAEVGVDNSSSPPMPNVPPPSPPKDVQDVVVPFGIALYDYNTKQGGDLQFMVNDVIYLVKQVNNDWMMGRTIDDREGIFPSCYIDIRVPLKQDSTTLYKSSTLVVQALYDFETNIFGDLRFKAGDSINVIRIIDSNWLEGECQGRRGQFPSNFVNCIQGNL